MIRFQLNVFIDLACLEINMALNGFYKNHEKCRNISKLSGFLSAVLLADHVILIIIGVFCWFDGQSVNRVKPTGLV